MSPRRYRRVRGGLKLAYKLTNELVSEMNGIVSNEIKLIYGHSKKTKVEIEEESKKIKTTADRMQHNVMDIEKTVQEFEELAALQGLFFERISTRLDQMQ